MFLSGGRTWPWGFENISIKNRDLKDTKKAIALSVLLTSIKRYRFAKLMLGCLALGCLHQVFFVLVALPLSRETGCRQASDLDVGSLPSKRRFSHVSLAKLKDLYLLWIKSFKLPVLCEYCRSCCGDLRIEAALTNDIASSTHMNVSSDVKLTEPHRNSNFWMERKFHPKYFNWLGFMTSIIWSTVYNSID